MKTGCLQFILFFVLSPCWAQERTDYKKVSFLVFHDIQDDVVLPEFFEKMVKEIKKKDRGVKFPLYPEANHNCWDKVFSESKLLSYVFS